MHTTTSSNLTLLAGIFGIVALAILICLFVWLWKRREYWLAFGALWMVLFLLPTLITMKTAGMQMADRFVFVSSIGSSWIIASLWVRWKDFVHSRLPIMILGAYFAFMVISTLTQAFFWRNDWAFCRQMIKIAPKYPGGHAGLGLLFLEKGELDSAYLYTARALEIDSTYLPALSPMGRIHQLKGDLDSMRNCLELTIRYFPRNVDAHANLGVYYILVGDTILASKYFMRAVELAPHDYNTNQNLGSVLLSLGDTTKGLIFLRRACEYFPEGIEAPLILFEYYLMSKDSSAAMDILDEYPQIEPFAQEYFRNTCSTAASTGINSAR